MKIISFKICSLFFIPLMLFLLIAGTDIAIAAQKVPINFNDYHGYTKTVKYVKDVAKAYSNITKLLEIGKSTM